jgi:hypothetical protein
MRNFRYAADATAVRSTAETSAVVLPGAMRFVALAAGIARATKDASTIAITSARGGLDARAAWGITLPRSCPHRRRFARSLTRATPRWSPST